MDLLTLFCNYHPNFMERLNSFSELNKERLLKKLKSAKNKEAFRSTISEIRFGEFFQKLNFEIEYDKKFNNQTPDWTLNYSSFPIICDVYRLGKSSKDQKKSDFENLLREQLEEIPSNLILKIKIDDSYSNYEEIRIDSIKKQTERWLENKPRINDRLKLDYGIRFKVIAISGKSEFLSFISSGTIDYKIGKIQQEENHRPNEITKKLNKYNDIITTKKLPFFLCVDFDFESGFHHKEFEEYFLGSKTSFIDFDPNKRISTEIGILGSEWTKLGKFYENIQISGIITCSNNDFRVLLNPICKQLIYENQHNEYLTELRKYGYVR